MWGLTEVSCQGPREGRSVLGPPHSAPEPLATALKSPRAGLRLSFPAVLGLQNRDFLRRKGKGHTLGGQADGNSW